MNAKEARGLTIKSTQVRIVDLYVGEIDARIRSAAKSGKGNLVHPFSGLDIKSENEKEALKLYYITEGFNVIEHPDPDPGHPMSRAYTEIRW